MKFVVGLSLAIALGEFVLLFVFPDLVAVLFFGILMLFGDGNNITPFPAMLTIISMTVGPALLIKWLTTKDHVS